VQLYTKYKSTRPRKNSGPWFSWLLLAPGLALLGWFWWEHRERSASNSAVAAQTNRELALISTTNLPVRISNASNPPSPLNIHTTSPPVSGVISTSAPPAAFVQRPPQNVYEAQLALARRAISSGSLDGAIGSQTRAALRAFQEKEHLPVTGALDASTKQRLTLTEPPERMYSVTSNDLARLTEVGATWLAKSEQKRLDYETILELVAERGQAHPNLIRLLNPSIDWSNVVAGTTVAIPNVQFPPIRRRAATVHISLSNRTLRALDSDDVLLAHFPCSIARRVEKRPVGQLFVEEVALNPTYRFDPDNFPESAEGRKLGRTLIIPAGPNNPVGLAWIGLNLPGYGIHGTPRPEEVGRTESHGCFRLANWNAEYLAQLVRGGTPVLVEP
jgi:lipoprotein-anchoring transpeptidase ErfK/SrfK